MCFCPLSTLDSSPIWQGPRHEIKLYQWLAERVLCVFAQGRISLDLYATKLWALVPRFVRLPLRPTAPGPRWMRSRLPSGSELVSCTHRGTHVQLSAITCGR